MTSEDMVLCEPRLCNAQFGGSDWGRGGPTLQTTMVGLWAPVSRGRCVGPPDQCSYILLPLGHVMSHRPRLTPGGTPRHPPCVSLGGG